MMDSLGKGIYRKNTWQKCRDSSGVERVLGKDEAGGSRPPRGTSQALFWSWPAFIRSSFLGHIRHVFSAGSGNKVRGVYAERIIACVHDVAVIAKRPIGEFIGNPMNSMHFISDLYLAVAFGQRPAPLPTHILTARRRWNVNFCPKAGNCDRGINTHFVLLFRDVLARVMWRLQPLHHPHTLPKERIMSKREMAKTAQRLLTHIRQQRIASHWQKIGKRQPQHLRFIPQGWKFREKPAPPPESTACGPKFQPPAPFADKGLRGGGPSYRVMPSPAAWASQNCVTKVLALNG